jgi:hypothetical protein
MANKDLRLMNTCIAPENQKLFLKNAKEKFDYPLDDDITREIKEIIKVMREEDDDYEIFKHKETLNGLWKSLIEKSIKCLRLFDNREPFTNKLLLEDEKFMVNQDKKPSAHGIADLFSYYKKFTEFEKILYGASKYYRDHIVHVFRTWLSGINCLVKGKYLEEINIKTDKNKIIELNNCEKLSIWTIIALTHDLGYPLEKAKEIIDATNNMVSTFLTNTNVSMDLSFHGVQNYMNDFILRLISSKMDKKEKDSESYYARLQPKYYFKFQKSLEKKEHGIISTLIIYKLLIYFQESDYNINEDYSFDKDERRQFYIRREILRSIASHTCKDIYHLYMCSFPFLLIVTDNTQEWGRKYISELYVESGKEYELDGIELTTAEDKNNKCEISEEFKLQKKHSIDSVENLLRRLHKQALSYVMMFRDGQDTNNRDFAFTKRCKITYEGKEDTIKLTIILDINNRKQSTFTGRIEYKKDSEINKEFNEDFFKNLFDEPEIKKLISWKPEGEPNTDLTNYKNWKTGTISFPLVN